MRFIYVSVFKIILLNIYITKYNENGFVVDTVWFGHS